MLRWPAGQRETWAGEEKKGGMVRQKKDSRKENESNKSV